MCHPKELKFLFPAQAGIKNGVGIGPQHGGQGTVMTPALNPEVEAPVLLDCPAGQKRAIQHLRVPRAECIGDLPGDSALDLRFHVQTPQDQKLLPSRA